MEKQITVQELLSKTLLDNNAEENETVQVLDFLAKNGVPLTNDQAKAMFLLQEFGMSDISNYVINVRQYMTPIKWLFKMVDKMTLADRIKGNAKLGNILKQNANPASGLNTEAAAKAGK